jgi:hypothetical protein
MSLSARDQRILTEIARDLAAAEPRLARALATARLPVPRRSALVATDDGQRRPGTWIAAILASLLAGIALLTAGLVLNIPALACAGAVMTQISPATLGFLYARARRAAAYPARLPEASACRLPPRSHAARPCSPCTPRRTC